MHIIIPMSGLGNRFVQAGYQEPKPLIVIDGKPIIEHVCDLFPNEDKITFICREEHLQNTNMRDILTRIRPTARIVSTPGHKLGPVYAVSQLFDQIDDHEEVIVNYCDFGAFWDYADFLKHTRNRNADGAIPAYRHFHPHMLGSTNYAFMRDQNQWMLEIQEKKPFTENRMQEFASSGTYYFKHGRYIKKYFQQLMDLKLDLNGEYYVSMIYNLLLKDKLSVSIYEIQHMLQWGTPEDVEEYYAWSNYFRCLSQQQAEPLKLAKPLINLIPLAGQGSRFRKVGYSLPKPLIPISGKPMIIQATDALPRANQYRFVCLQEHLNQYPLQETIHEHYPEALIIPLDQVTEGQAITCNLGLENVSDETSLLIAACDNSMLVNPIELLKLIQNDNVDGIVFTFKNHPSVKRNPHMYGYVKVNVDNEITGVSVKTPISNEPTRDHAIVGAFYFKSSSLFKEGLAALKAKNIRINGEFYVDSLIGELAELGYKLHPLLVEHYICWGTPDDLKTFEYWQSFFHKVEWHPYRMENDPNLNIKALPELENLYTSFTQEYV